MPVEGTALPLWGLEIDPDRAKEDFRAFNARDDGKVTDVPAILIAACVLKLLSYHVSESRLHSPGASSIVGRESPCSFMCD